MKIAANMLELIGHTPVVCLNKMSEPDQARVYVKLEGFNPGGSIKDRPGLFMIEYAESQGLIKADSIILEATSGNTGIGLAMAAALKGYPIVIVMPENMSIERMKILKAYGAELVLTPAQQGMAGAVEKARQMAAANPCYYLIKQFENEANALSHEVTTAQEIVQQMDGRLDALVCGVGSGGTITGLGRALKKAMPDIKIIAVEPFNSQVLAGKPAQPHKIQGIGAGFVPQLLKLSIIDKIIPVRDDDAINTCRRLAREEAMLLGISSGAAVWAALELARSMAEKDRILAIAPDGAEKYMSTELFDEGEL